MTLLHNPTDWHRRPLGWIYVRRLTAGLCADCRNNGLVWGPRDGSGQNVACSTCGSEFHVGFHGRQVAFALRNSRPGQPNLARLRDVFEIDLT